MADYPPKLHVKRLYASDGSGGLDTSQWVDLLRYDSWKTTSRAAPDQPVWQGTIWYLAWRDSLDLPATTHATIQNENNNPVRTPDLISVGNPDTEPVDGYSSGEAGAVDLYLLDATKTEMRGHPSGLRSTAKRYWKNEPLTGENIKKMSYVRNVAAVRAVHNDLGGFTFPPSGVIDWDTYQTALQVGTIDETQFLDQEVTEKFFVHANPQVDYQRNSADDGTNQWPRPPSQILSNAMHGLGNRLHGDFTKPFFEAIPPGAPVPPIRMDTYECVINVQWQTGARIRPSVAIDCGSLGGTTWTSPLTGPSPAYPGGVQVYFSLDGVHWDVVATLGNYGDTTGYSPVVKYGVGNGLEPTGAGGALAYTIDPSYQDRGYPEVYQLPIIPIIFTPAGTPPIPPFGPPPYLVSTYIEGPLLTWFQGLNGFSSYITCGRDALGDATYVIAGWSVRKSVDPDVLYDNIPFFYYSHEAVHWTPFTPPVQAPSTLYAGTLRPPMTFNCWFDDGSQRTTSEQGSPPVLTMDGTPTLMWYSSDETGSPLYESAELVHWSVSDKIYGLNGASKTDDNYIGFDGSNASGPLAGTLPRCYGYSAPMNAVIGVAIASDGTVTSGLATDDPSTWSTVTLPDPAAQISTMDAEFSATVAAANATQEAAYSFDGRGFTYTPPTSPYLTWTVQPVAVAYTNGLFTIVGKIWYKFESTGTPTQIAPVIWSSEDGTHWVVRSSNLNNPDLNFPMEAICSSVPVVDQLSPNPPVAPA